MAEAVVSLVVNKLTLMLAEGVIEWLQVGSNLHRKVSDIKDELESIQIFLRDADERAEKTEDQHINNGVETWVKQVRQVAYRIEDVIDEYTLRVTPHGGASDPLHGLFSKSIKKINRLVKNFRPRHEIGAEIEEIKASLVEIKNRSDRYRLISSSESSRSRASTPWLDPRVASHFISDTDVVGVEDVKRELIGLLVGEPRKRKVIAVEGMGGLGKTTLAKVVYESSIIKEHFLCCAWITVSQSYKKDEIFKYLARHFCEAQESSLEDHAVGISEEVQMISKIRRSLQGKRYLIVFDDIWNVNFWGEFEHAFPDDNVGSRILITTRNKDVANFCKKSSLVHVHKLQLLPPSFAWKLFCKTAFQFDSEEYNCPKMLENLSANIVQKCGGLPLAIVVIGGLLSTKDKSLQEWQRLHDMLHSELESNPHLTSITMILSLSYRDLPYYLKCCFLYFGVFPEDYSIIVSRMIRLWISEGFVKAKQGRTLEEVAEGYIAELSQRNMIQSYWGFSGVMKCCKVHDLMRETISPLIGKLSYCQVLDAEKESYPSLNREVRRLSVHNNIGNILKKERVAVRSFFVFSTNHELDKALMDTLFESFTLLKVLDLEDCPYVSYLPENVGNLLHLRYLCVKSREIKNLPKSIGKLLNLETLNLADTQVQELPMEIYRLRKLRHLLCGRFDSEVDYGLDSRRGVKIHKGIGELQDLQMLIC